MKRLAVDAFLILMLFGCASVGTAPESRPEICIGQKSLIYDTFESVRIKPKTVAGFFSMALYVSLEERLIMPQEAKAGLATIEAMLSQDTVSYYVALCAIENLFGPLNTGKAARYIAFALPMFSEMMKVELPISACDRFLLSQFCAEQRAMINKYFGG